MAAAILVTLGLLLATTAFDRGAALYRERKYEAAIAELRTALREIEPDTAQHAEALLLLGQSLFSSGRFAEAIEPLTQRRAIAPRTEIDYMLGIAYLQSREFSKARAAFASMFGLDAGSAAARLVCAQLMVRNGFEAEAEKELLAAVEGGAAVPGVYLLLGELAIARGDADAAIHRLRDELRIHPASDAAYYKLGDAHTRKENWSEAIANLQKSIWLNPYQSGPYILLAKAYLKTDSAVNAEGLLRRALQLDPNNKSAHYLLGQALMRNGKPEEGRRMLERFRELGGSVEP
jgi:tetratricopeptide (TPR) repeat protein